MAAKKATKMSKAAKKSAPKSPKKAAAPARATKRAASGGASLTKAAVTAALAGPARTIQIKDGSQRLKDAFAARAGASGAKYVKSQGLAVSKVVAAADMLARALDEVCAENPGECPSMYLEIALQTA